MGRGATFCAGLFVFLGIFVFSVVAGGTTLAFVHIPSALFVLGATGGLGLAGYRGNGFLGYLASCQKHLIIAGALGAGIGAIQLLTHLSNPEHLGPGLATALLTLLYSVILYGITESYLSITGAKQSRTAEQ